MVRPSLVGLAHALALPEPLLMLRGCLWFVSLQKAWLLRSRSFSHEEIENLLANDHQELIGDFSKVGPQGCWRSGGAAPFLLKQRGFRQSPAPVQEPKSSCGGPCLGTWGCDFPACRPCNAWRA